MQRVYHQARKDESSRRRTEAETHADPFTTMPNWNSVLGAHAKGLGDEGSDAGDFPARGWSAWVPLYMLRPRFTAAPAVRLRPDLARSRVDVLAMAHWRYTGYSTLKVVKVKDWRLGVLHYFFQVGTDRIARVE